MVLGSEKKAKQGQRRRCNEGTLRSSQNNQKKPELQVPLVEPVRRRRAREPGKHGEREKIDRTLRAEEIIADESEGDGNFRVGRDPDGEKS